MIPAFHLVRWAAAETHRAGGAEDSPHLEVCICLILVGAVDACHNIRPRELHLRRCMPDSMRPTAFQKASNRRGLQPDDGTLKRHHLDKVSPQGSDKS